MSHTHICHDMWRVNHVKLMHSHVTLINQSCNTEKPCCIVRSLIAACTPLIESMHTNMSHVTHMNASCSKWNRCIHTKWLEHSRTRTHTRTYTQPRINKHAPQKCAHTHAHTHTHFLTTRNYTDRKYANRKNPNCSFNKNQKSSQKQIWKWIQKYMYKCKHTQKLFKTFITSFFCMHFDQKLCKSKIFVCTRGE